MEPVYCGRCGEKMVFEPADGRNGPRYVCMSREPGGLAMCNTEILIEDAGSGMESDAGLVGVLEDAMNGRR